VSHRRRLTPKVSKKPIKGKRDHSKCKADDTHKERCLRWMR